MSTRSVPPSSRLGAGALSAAVAALALIAAASLALGQDAGPGESEPAARPAPLRLGVCDVLVTGFDDRPVAGASVAVHPWSREQESVSAWNRSPRAAVPEPRSDTTDERGRASFAGLPEGRTAIAVTAPGRATASSHCVVVSGGTTDVVVRLEAGHALSGRVLGPDGEACAGFDVSAGVLPGSPRTVTDSDGRYELTGLPCGIAKLSVSPPGVYWRGLQRVLVPSVSRHDVVFESLPVVRGAVRDEDTGEPVAGAAVRIESYRHLMPPWSGTTTSDADGRWSLRWPVNYVGHVSVSHDGYRTATLVPDDVEELGARGATYDLSLAPAERPAPAVTETPARPSTLLRGRVVRSNGEPAAGVQVENERFGLRGWTNTDGRYLVRVPSGVPLADLRLGPRSESVEQPATLAEDPKRPGELAATTIVLSPPPQQPRARVLVVDAGGAPVAGAHVSFGSPWGARSESRSGADGRADVPVYVTIPTIQPSGQPSGHTTISAWAPGHGRAVTAVPKSSPFEPPDVTLRLPAYAPLRGRVVAGHPTRGIAGAALRMSPDARNALHVDFGYDDSSQWVLGTTEADGSFALPPLPRADVPLEIVPPRPYLKREISDTSARWRVRDIEVLLPVTIRGSVQFEDGTPASHATVEALHVRESRRTSRYQGEGVHVTVVCDDVGSFELRRVAPGPIRMLARPTPGRSAGFLTGRKLGEVDESGLPPVLFVVSRGRRVSGRVEDPNGEPVAGASVEAAASYRVSESPWATSPFADGLSTTTDPAGEFVLEGLEQREYVLRVIADPLVPTRVLLDEEAGRATVKLERRTSISGRLTDAAGDPLGGVRLKARPETPRPDDSRYAEPEARTAPDGTFRFDALRPGRWRLGTSRLALTPAPVAAGDQRLSFVATPLREHDLVVVVTDEQGAPIDGAKVALFEADDGTGSRRVLWRLGDWRRDNRTDSEGSVTLRVRESDPVRHTVDATASVRAAGFHERRDIPIEALDRPLRVTLSRGRVLTGTARFRDGRPAAGVWLRIDGARRFTSSDPRPEDDPHVFTDAAGRFAFSALPDGELSIVRVTHPGAWHPTGKPTRVGPGDTEIALTLD